MRWRRRSRVVGDRVQRNATLLTQPKATECSAQRASCWRSRTKCRALDTQPTEPGYDPSQIKLPSKAKTKAYMTASQRLCWEIKSEHYDGILF